MLRPAYAEPPWFFKEYMMNVMTLDEMRAIFNEERPSHPEWPSAFGLVLAPAALALLEFYHRHPTSRRSWRLQKTYPRVRAPDIRRKPATPFRGLDQKRLASGEKPDEDD